MSTTADFVTVDRDERRLNVGTWIMMSGVIPAIVIVAALFFGGLPLPMTITLAGLGLGLIVGGSLIANWKVAIAIWAFIVPVMFGLFWLIFSFLPKWLPSIGINF